MARWVTVRQAAEYFECSTDTIKRRIKAGLLPSQQERTPQGYRLLVELSDGAVPPASEPQPEPVSTHTVEALLETIRVLNAQLEAAQRPEEWYMHELTTVRALPAPPQDQGTPFKRRPHPTPHEPLERPTQSVERPWWRFW